MISIVGRIFILAFALCSVYSVAEISMRITDENGVALESVGIGRPFLLHVEANTMYDVQNISVIHLDQYEHHRSGIQMLTMNNKRSVTYTYRCRIDTLGTHIIGPAIIDGTTDRSNILNIVVGEKPEYKQRSKKEDEKIFFRIRIQPEQLVVGQKAQIIARFYAVGTKIDLKNITLPALPSLRMVSQIGPEHGYEKINNILYDYVEWRYELFTKEPGAILIPAFCADYEISTEKKHSFFWRTQQDLKRVYSNSLRIQVDPLPEHAKVSNKKPDFIGRKAAVHATLQPVQAQIGEGISYTITFEGDGDIDAIKVPKLSGMPDEIKYYDSKVTPVSGNGQDILPKKKFEYVLQAMKEGVWIIPAQNFLVFDVDQKIYKTISTLPAQLTVSGGTIISKQNVSVPELIEQVDEETSKIRLIDQRGPWYPSSERAPINWIVFMLLVCAPWSYVGIRYAQSRMWLRLRSKRSAKTAFMYAKSAIERIAFKKQNYRELYYIFIRLFADVYGVEQHQISAQFIKEKLLAAGISDHVLIKWEHFFEQLAACAFGDQQDGALRLVTESRIWLMELKGLLT